MRDWPLGLPRFGAWCVGRFPFKSQRAYEWACMPSLKLAGGFGSRRFLGAVHAAQEGGE